MILHLSTVAGKSPRLTPMGKPWDNFRTFSQVPRCRSDSISVLNLKLLFHIENVKFGDFHSFGDGPGGALRDFVRPEIF